MKFCKSISFGLAASALALSTLTAQAQMADTPPMAGDTSSNTPAMTGDMGSTTTSMMTPMPVSGTVLRYYVDRAGFVSAMDVQAADGVKMVRFTPQMAQRLTGSFPVGSQITASVTQSSMSMGSMVSYDLAGLGANMPAPGAMMNSSMISDLDILRSEPYVMLGGKSMSVTGSLTDKVVDPDTGEVLALVLDDTTLVRVPRQNRLPQASTAPEGITPIMKGSIVMAMGMEEAPRYGVVSPYTKRVVATGLAVNGLSVGPFGLGRFMGVKKKMTDSTITPEQMSAMNMGYSPYMAPGTMTPPPADNGMMGNTPPAS